MKKFLAALAVVAACTIALPCNMHAAIPNGKSTAQGIEVAPTTEDPCGDVFSAAVRDDMVARVDGGASSKVLDPFLGDEVLIFQTRGYCQAREVENLRLTQDEFAASLVAELTAEANQYDHKVTYVSKPTKVLGGTSIAIVITPPADKIANAGVDFRIFTVFVFNDTRIVGVQLFTSVTGLKQP